MRKNRSAGGLILRCAYILLFMTIVYACNSENKQDYHKQENRIPTQIESESLSSGFTKKAGWKSKQYSVSAAEPRAVKAGYDILKAGGTAMDAAVVVQMVLNLTEPQSSGIGGGAFLMYWDGSEIYAYDGREKAPAAAGETLFIDEDGKELSFQKAVHSGLSVGVPGLLAMLGTAHKNHGLLPWQDLFNPAIDMANNGYTVGERLHRRLHENRFRQWDERAKNFYYNDKGEALPVGYLLKNRALARIFERIAESGVSAFYQGPLAENVTDRIQNHARPGAMTLSDINNYPDQDFDREAICSEWRTYTICGFPPPSSGHITIMQILGMLDHVVPFGGVKGETVLTAEWLHHYIEASKLAFADRNRFIADPFFVDPPAGNWESLLDRDYLKERAASISEESTGLAKSGNPDTVQTEYGRHPRQPESGTSHISIVDSYGHAVSMTTTIEQEFGSRILTDGGTGLPGGFLLNNELTDFSFAYVDDKGKKIANRVEPGKRPRSSMSPTFIFNTESGELLASIGSPGGAAIIHYTAKTILGMLDFELKIQEAINLPNFANFNGPTVLEKGWFSVEIIHQLEQKGHVIMEKELTSGIQGIQRVASGYLGGADPRREGKVMGD